MPLVAQSNRKSYNTKDGKSAARGDNQINNPGFLDISIEILGAPASETIDGKEVTFSEICPNFGKLLVSNSGLWGTGPFLRFQCLSDTTSAATKKFQWKLTATKTGDTTTFVISFFDPSTKQFSPQSEYKIDSPVSPLTLLKEPRYATLIAAYLSFGLPFRSTITSSSLRMGADLKIVGTALSDVPPPSQALEIFVLARSGGFWQFFKVGSAGFKSSTTPPRWLVQSVNKNSKAKSKGSLSDTHLFLHQSTGREEAKKLLDDTLKHDLENLLGKLLGVARSAYIGTRFGVPMGKGEGVFAKAPLIGIFGEFRGGLLAGMHIYYDVIPKLQGKNELVSEQFSWSRFQAGYGFGRAFDNPIVNWVDLMPKIGVTNLDLISTPTANSKSQPYTFKLNNAPTIGLELGVERRSEKKLIRLWAYGSYGLGVLLDKKIKTTGIRLGADFYRELASFGTTKFAALLFSAYDSTSFKKTLTAADQKIDPSAVSEIKYNSFFLGGGMAITW